MIMKKKEHAFIPKYISNENSFANIAMFYLFHFFKKVNIIF